MAENGIGLRQASVADCEFAYQTKKAALRKYVEMVWGWNEAEQRQMHERRFSAKDVKIVQLAGTDVGILALVREADCLMINQLFIVPKYQGRGIGRSCMMQVIADAKRSSVPVRLWVLKVNTRAASFYDGLGFKEIGQNDTHIMMERTP